MSYDRHCEKPVKCLFFDECLWLRSNLPKPEIASAQ